MMMYGSALTNRLVTIVLLVCILSFVLYNQFCHTPEWKLVSQRKQDQPDKFPAPSHEDITLVIASQDHDNTTWVANAVSAWEKAIFSTDSPSRLSVPLKKGRESMVYLT